MKSKIFALLGVLLVFVIVASMAMNSIWGGKPEEVNLPEKIIIKQEMSLASFASTNGLDKKTVAKAFGINSPEVLQSTLISSINLNNDEIEAKVIKAIAIEQEHASKNWQKILLKFVLWIAFLGVVFYLARKKKITPKTRNILYFISLTTFGVLLGADPSAMGTIKDAVVLYASSGAIFPPRLIALSIFLILVFFANKFFCGWGCQLGTLQDFIFRLNRNENDTKGVMKQYKIPFFITNGIRIVFFLLFTVVAFLWSADLVEYIDPFKIFKADKLGIIGIVFVGTLLVGSLFVYRPWCKMFCPFGLASWLVEKVSWHKIQVNYDSCIACDSCAKACPTDAMNTILKQKSTIADCFSCSTCINACPTNSISFKTGKREAPPKDKFL